MAHIIATLPQIIKSMNAIVAGIDSTMPLIIKGAPAPLLENKEEWVQFDFLSSFPIPAHAPEKRNALYMQVICFSRHAHLRLDRSIVAPWTLAEKYSDALTNLTVKVPVGDSSETSCFRIHEAKQVYLDLKSSGEFSKQIYLPSVPLDTHCVVLLLDAMQIESSVS